MDIFPLLEEIQMLARNGLHYAQNSYDRERYERLLALVSQYYGQTLDLPPETMKAQFSTELGHITPKLGADAAIFDEAGRILLMQRSDDQCWCLPCGWVEPNESPLEAAIRETYEECGLEVRSLQLVDVFTRKPSVTYGPHTMVAVVYLCEIVSGALTLSHEGLDLRYWEINAVQPWHKNHEQYARAAYAVWQRNR